MLNDPFTDRNRDDPNAEAKFQEIGEAYQVIANSDLRAAYDRYGKKSLHATPEDGFVDPGQLFAQLFGGERFFDWIGEISMGKDLSKAAEIGMTEEEKEAYKAEMAGEKPAAATGPAFATTPAAATAPGSNTPPGATTVPPPAPGAVPSSAAGVASGTDVNKHTPVGEAAAAGKHGKPQASNKLTPEQRKQMDALADERRQNEIERIHQLTEKLRERLRPFVQSASPGDANDVECQRWQKRMQEEIDDLKGQSFGIELCQLIGQIYSQKAAAYIKIHKSPMSNILGVSSWWGRMKDKGATIKDGWSLLSTTVDLQSEMSKLEKEGGDIEGEENAEKMAAWMMLVSFKGMRFEVSSVLRSVVDGVLSNKLPGVQKVSEVELMNRAKALLLLGTMLRNVKPDETDEERREMERLVAKVNADRKAKKGKKEKV